MNNDGQIRAEIGCGQRARKVQFSAPVDADDDDV